MPNVYKEKNAVKMKNAEIKSFKRNKLLYTYSFLQAYVFTSFPTFLTQIEFKNLGFIICYIIVRTFGLQGFNVPSFSTYK